MWSSLSIAGFRSWSSLRLDELARVNVLVGRNGAGKTAVLDAAEALATRYPFRSCVRREEMMHFERPSGDVATGVAIECAFHGRKASVGSKISVAATSRDSGDSSLSMFVLGSQRAEDATTHLAVSAAWSPDGSRARWELSDDGFAVAETREIATTPTFYNCRFVPARSLQGQAAVKAFTRIAGNPEEDAVLDALRIVEPGIQRVVVGGGDMVTLFARLAGEEQRVALGSLGDGVMRMLVLATELANARGGVLLVDEIEAGLHVSVMSAMWRMLLRTAAKLDVQVFATTHSDDCLRGLGGLFVDGAPDEDRALGPAVCAFRLDRGVDHATRYSSEEIGLSAVSGIEIRG